MNKLITMLLFLMIYSFVVNAQRNAEEYIINEIFDNILLLDSFNQLKNKWQKEVTFTLDPVTFESGVIYNDSVNQEVLREISKYDKQELDKILKAPKLPIIPLSDTLYIVDTLAFFSNQIIKKKNKTLIVVTNVHDDDSNKCIFYKRSYVRKHWLTLTFGFPNYDKLLYFTFDINDKIQFKELRDFLYYR